MSSRKRQPVLLTDNELNEIINDDKEAIITNYGKEDFYKLSLEEQNNILNKEKFLKDEDVIKYGSDPNKKFNYICPRYWCLKTNKPINPNEMVEVTKNGKKVLEHPTCGGIIPDDQKEVKDDGNYIYEFNDSGHHLDSYGNYKKQFPGFLDPKKHPSGKCAPCCFSKYHSKDQIARRA